MKSVFPLRKVKSERNRYGLFSALALFFSLLLGSAQAQTVSYLDSLIDNDLPLLDEFHAGANYPDYRFTADTLYAKLVPMVDQETIEDRASCLQLDMPLVTNKTVCGFIHFFTVRKRNYTQTMLERKNYYFPIFEYYLKKHQMPDALKYLSIVESGLNFKAKSRTGALGLWQFMPGTGKDFYLAQNQHIDERQNPYLATEAACKFLKYLYGLYGDWELALAAYNCGPGNVNKAIRKSGKRGFWEIYEFLPKETRSYVPQFHAVVYSMNFASEHNIFPDVDSILVTTPLDTFHIAQSFDISKLEKLIGLPKQALSIHNPTLRTHVFPGDSKYPFLVPTSHSSLLASNLNLLIDSAKIELPLPEKEIEYRWVQVKKGQKPSEVADRYGLEVKELCKINHIRNSAFHKSRKLRIPKDLKLQEATEPVVAKVKQSRKDTAENKQEKQSEEVAEGFYRVKKGEKLYQIAIETGTSTSKLKKWNHLKSSMVNEGQILRVQAPEADENLAVSDKDTCPQEKGLASSQPSEKQSYLVVKGDRLFSISKQFGVTVEDLIAANPELIQGLKAGQKINIPASHKASPKVAAVSVRKKELSLKQPQVYQVQKGDTLYSIARKFPRLSIRDLMRLNKLKDKNIKPGQQLIIG
jgi:membrane-bound lytic murein transglycosylase D